MSQKWRARVETKVAGRFKYMGYHKSAIAAAWSYDRYVRRVGLDLPLNFVDDDAAEAAIEKEKEAKVSEQQAKAKASFCRTLYTLVLGSLVATLSFASFSSLLPENVRSCFISFLPLPIVLTPLYLSLLLYSPLTGKHRVLPSFLGAKCCARCVRALSTRAPREQRS